MSEYDPSCELCRAEGITEWFYEDEICWCALCRHCHVPMVVLKRHTEHPTLPEAIHLLCTLWKVANQYFGMNPQDDWGNLNWWLDPTPRKNKGHVHYHARGRLTREQALCASKSAQAV